MTLNTSRAILSAVLSNSTLYWDKNVLDLLDWPESSFVFFHTSLQKPWMNIFFSQRNALSSTVTSSYIWLEAGEIEELKF